MLADLKHLQSTLAVLIIMAAIFVCYWPALRNDFVWDDTALVLRDPLIRSWVLIPEGFRHFLFLDATASSFYRPIQRLTFVADYACYGFNQPGGWHATSILVHAGAAVALYFLARRVLGERRWALAVALLWAVHPLHTSAVTYVSGRADPLAALFGFTGLVLGLTSLETTRHVSWRRLGATACFALALLSKESGITFLLVWLLVLGVRRVGWAVFGRWALVLAAVLGGYCALRFTAHQTPPPAPPPTPLAIRPILTARALAEYTALVVAPVSLRMERDVSTKPQGDFEATMRNARTREYQTLAGVLLLVGLALWGRFCWRRAPTAAVCLGAFAIAYAPISNAFSLNATIAEHWLYVPSAFLFLAIALTLAALGKSERCRSFTTSAPVRLALTAAFSAWALLLGARTFARQADWRDQRTFIERTIAAGGDSPRMLMNLGNVESNAGQHASAVALYREALRRTPEQPIIWLGFSNLLVRARDVPAARQALERAETSPLLAAECRQLRAVLDHLEHGKDPRDGLRSAVELAPESWPIRRRYVEALLEAGDLEGARRELGGFMEKQPFRAESWKLLARLAERMNQHRLAGAAYRQARMRDVRDQEAKEAAWRFRGAGL